MDFLNIIKIITVFQISLVCVFLLVHKARRSKRNLCLVLFIGSKALYVADTVLLSAHEAVLHYAPNILLIGSSFQLLLGPAMYYAMVVMTRPEFVFRRRHLFHAVPFLLHLGFMISQYHIHDTATKVLLFQEGFPYNTPWAVPAACMTYLQFAAYGVCSLVMLSRTREELYRLTSQSLETNLRFLKFIAYDFIIVWGINILSMFAPLPQLGWEILQPATVFNIFFIANAIVYQGLKFPMLFHGDLPGRQKYEKNLLSEEEKGRYVGKLVEFMHTQRPYLNPTLSLADLARQLAVPTHVVSQVLNVELKQNFYDFVNSFRIEVSKQMLVEPPDGARSILEVLYQSGFNSKSVFNAAFKKHTGLTPREFKKTVYSPAQSSPATATLQKYN